MNRSDRYQITETIAKGDFATVYRGRDHELGRDVAIKQIHQQYLEDPRQLDRYWQEAQLLASLEHPNIMTIYDVVRERGWLILELAQGSLPQLLGGRGIDIKDLRLALNYTLHALKFMHEHGIIHGDVKPGNLLVDRNARVKLGDFGIARRLAGDDGSVVKGTTKYMAPEVVSDQFGAVGPHSDLYSLGFTAFELMCGDHFETLFPGLNMYGRDQQIAWMMWHSAADRRLPEISRTLDGVPADLARIIQRLVEKDPAKRYRTAGEVLADLSTEGEAPPASVDQSAEEESARQATQAKRKRTLVIAAASCSIILSMAMLFIPNREPPQPATKKAVALQPADGQIVQLDPERSQFFITPAAGGRALGIVVDPNVDRLFVNGERAALADLLKDDQVHIDYLTGGAGPFMEIYATRELATTTSGVLRSMDTSSAALTFEALDGSELVVHTNDITKYTLNDQTSRLSLLRPEDRLSVEHRAANDGSRLALRVTALRTLSLSGKLVRANDTEVAVQVDAANTQSASAERTLRIAGDCAITLNGATHHDSRPLSPFDLRAADRVTLEYDVAVHRIEAFRDVTESGVVASVDYNKRTFTATRDESGETATFILGAGCRMLIDSGPVDLYFLRPGDRVTVQRKSPDPANREADQVAIVPQPDPRTWAIVINYETYDNPDLPPIRFGEADGSALLDTLRTRYRVPEDQLLHQQDATRLALEGAVGRFLTRVPSGSQLLVYYLGHGYISDQQTGYLVPQGFDVRRVDSTGLAVRWLIEQVEQCPATEKIILLDAGQVAGAESPIKQVSAVELAESVKETPRGPVSTSAIVIASSDRGESAAKLDDRGRGAFSVCVEDAFAGEADINRNHRIDANELFSFVNRKLNEVAANSQTPKLFLPDATPARLSPEAKLAVIRVLASLQGRIDDQLLLDFNRAKQLAAGQPDADLAYGLVQMKANRTRAALQVLNEVRLQHPDASVAYHALAWKSFWESDYKDGLLQLEHLAKHLPSAGDAHEQRYSNHALEFAGRVTAYAELVKREIGPSDLQKLRQAISDRGDAAKEAYRAGYFSVRDMLESLNRQIAAETDAQKKAALERDRGRIGYYVEMNYDEAEAFLRTGLDR
ncbi:MAG TPA: serine/threonine-protein kinase [Pirellulaceae bacterium]|nr:serine/threonine-protein kinase [Pirellulaceae bacterium]